MTDFDISDLANLEEFLKSCEVPPLGAGPPPTLMDIAGYPNWENVYSNILAFLLDTRKPHNFGPLFIRAILGAYRCHCLEEWREGAPDPEGVEVTYNVGREEVTTDTKKRIDILVECADFLLCIENKIWSNLHNDLGEYREHCENNSSERPVLGIVLGPDRIHNPSLQKHRFVSITYDDLVKQVRRRMGSYVGPHNTRYQYLLFDFLEQASRLTMTEDQKKFLKFWRENDENIRNIRQQCDKMFQSPNPDVRELAQAHHDECFKRLEAPERKVFGEHGVGPGGSRRAKREMYSYFALAENYCIDGYRIFLDAEFWPHRVILVLGDRNSKSESQALDELIKKIVAKSKIDFEYHDHPEGSYKKIIKRSNESPFEESAFAEAVDNSVEILKAIARIHSADQQTQQETS